MKKQFQTILSCSLGNILECMTSAYLQFSHLYLVEIFFPTGDLKNRSHRDRRHFAIGFLARPVGALIFGYLGDKYGRASTLRLSILTITIPTLLIGILPTYQQIGIAAPLLLMLIRIMQGISIGGEYSGNLIYLAETSPERFRATFTTFASMGANLGILLASFVGMISSLLLSHTLLESWGWRIPYLISGLLCLIIYKYRLKIAETNVFTHLKQQHQICRNPIKTVLTKNFPELCRTLGLVCMGSTFYFFCFVYLPFYLTSSQSMSIHKISVVMISMMILMILLVPLAGLLCDYFGRKIMLMFNATFVCLIVIPGFYLLQFNQASWAIAVLLVFIIGSTLEQGATPVAVVENFPAPARYTGVSFGYNLGNGILGGTVPMICAWLASRSPLSIAPAIYIAWWALVTGLVVYYFIPPKGVKCYRTV